MPIVTITRGSFGASRKVAALIGRELDCKVLTREELLEHARKYGVEETKLGASDFFETNAPSLWDRHAAQRRRYLIYLKASLLDFAATGNAVYLGNMGQFILSDVPKLLRIRIDASMDFRMHGLMDESNLSETQAKRQIKDIDATRRKWAKFLYDADFDSPRHYDMILNLERMTVESASEVIACTLRRPEWKWDQATARTMKNLHLSAIVTAHLARSKRTRGMEVAVECDAQNGSAKVRGVPPLVGTTTWKHDIRDVVTEVEGIKSVEIVDQG
ncbi:MAG: cytidylate kinase-like family protein [Candidatus Latescibacterota bacterium]|nr:MAG: cytidylate kinase-like family protein [Candidatus Latescibacterota bacterium]